MNGQQLKNSILQMAVQGKLVPQDPNDEPASVLLEKIRKEKERLIKEGKIKKEKNPSFIFRGADNLPYEKVGSNEPICIADEVPFEIPESWEWVKLKNITVKEIKRGKSPKYADSGSVYVFAQKCNMKLGEIDISLAKFLDMNIFEKYPTEEYMLDGDIIINSTGNGTLGRIGMFHDTDRINDFIIVPDSHVTIIRTCRHLKKDYLFYTLKYYQPYLEKRGEGSTNQTELRPATVAELFIPVPPIEEQERISEKLLEVLPMIDIYGEKEKLLQAYNADFPTQLKKSILQQAVQGKLVPQNPDDESASILLQHIREEKKKLIAEGKIKKDKHESVIFRRDNSHYEIMDGVERCIDDEIPFEIPSSWEWVRLGSIGETAIGLTYKPNDKTDKENGTAVLRSNNIQNDKMNYDNLVYVSCNVPKRAIINKGEILICARNGSRALVGKAAIVNAEGMAFGAFMAKYTSMLSGTLNPYIMTFIESPVFRNQLDGVKTVTINQVTQDMLKLQLIPLPPLAEQYRIVKKLEEVLSTIKSIQV